MCIGKTTDVIWECLELWIFKLKQSRFHRNHSLIRLNQGHDFLSWINLICTACSLSSLGFHWLSVSAVTERTPAPGRTGLVPVLNWITNTHLVIKLLWALQWKDGGGNTLGSGVGTFRLPRGISHKLLSLHFHLQPLIWEQQALKGWKTKTPPFPSMCSQVHRKDSLHLFWGAKAACKQLYLPMDKSHSECSQKDRALGEKRQSFTQLASPELAPLYPSSRKRKAT